MWIFRIIFNTTLPVSTILSMTCRISPAIISACIVWRENWKWMIIYKYSRNNNTAHVFEVVPVMAPLPEVYNSNSLIEKGKNSNSTIIRCEMVGNLWEIGEYLWDRFIEKVKIYEKVVYKWSFFSNSFGDIREKDGMELTFLRVAVLPTEHGRPRVLVERVAAFVEASVRKLTATVNVTRRLARRK